MNAHERDKRYIDIAEYLANGLEVEAERLRTITDALKRAIHNVKHGAEGNTANEAVEAMARCALRHTIENGCAAIETLGRQIIDGSQQTASELINMDAQEFSDIVEHGVYPRVDTPGRGCGS